MRLTTTLLITATAQLCCLPLTYADETDVHPFLTEKYMVGLGVFFPERTVRMRVDGPTGGIRDEIDFESEFGLKRSDETFSLNFGWRLGEKWHLQGQYFDTSGERGAVLDEDIEWGEVVFGQGTGVVAGQDFTLIRAFFARQFETSEKHEFGIGAGIHWLELGAFIEGNIIVNGGGTQFRRESVEADAPLPNIGAWYIYSMTPRLALRTRFDWFSASVGDYDGTLINATAGANYQLFENFGVGLNYNLFDLDVSVNKSGWRGKAETKYEGLFAYVSFYW
jgi:hypothetical protein